MKYESNFWRSLDLALLNCETEIHLSLLNDCVICKISQTLPVAANQFNPAREVTETTGATFQITIAKIYVAIVTLAINGNIKF